MKGDTVMKKLVALLICFVMMFSLCACGREEAKNEEKEPQNTEEGTANMVNPCTEYSSLEEVNEIIGGNLCAPGVMGVSDRAFVVIDCGSYKIGEYQFTVAGYDYNLRCAKTGDDISGVYLSGGEGTAFEGQTAETDDNGIQSNADNETKCARWFVDDMQYVLSVNDNGGMDHETFMSIADEMMHNTCGDM